MMERLGKTFRHLSRKEKLEELVTKGWLSEENRDMFYMIH